MSSLNEKLISEFVETTTPKQDTRNHEFTINGTVQSVDNSGVANVLLDGGEVAPCQTTVGCSTGDRVIVSFKNREPVVTSNISKPTATIDYVDAQTVSAINVFATNGTFSGELSAATGTFSGEISIVNRNTGARVVVGPDASAAIQIIGPDDGTNSVGYINDRGATFQSGGAGAWYYAGWITMTSSDSTKYINIYPNGVWASDGSRLISQSEISAISTHTSTLSSHGTTLSSHGTTLSSHGTTISSHGTAITNLQNTVKNAMLYRGQFTGNLNSTTISPGFYYVSASNSYSGTKPSPNPTWCLFIQTNAYNTQIFVDASDKFIAFRDYTGSPASWGAWRKLTAS